MLRTGGKPQVGPPPVFLVHYQEVATTALAQCAKRTRRRRRSEAGGLGHYSVLNSCAAGCTAMTMPVALHLVPLAGFAGLTATAAFEDLRRLVIPNRLVLGLFLLWPF